MSVHSASQRADDTEWNKVEPQDWHRSQDDGPSAAASEAGITVANESAGDESWSFGAAVHELEVAALQHTQAASTVMNLVKKFGGASGVSATLVPGMPRSHPRVLAAPVWAATAAASSTIADAAHDKATTAETSHGPTQTLPTSYVPDQKAAVAGLRSGLPIPSSVATREAPSAPMPSAAPLQLQSQQQQQERKPEQPFAETSAPTSQVSGAASQVTGTAQASGAASQVSGTATSSTDATAASLEDSSPQPSSIASSASADPPQPSHGSQLHDLLRLTQTQVLAHSPPLKDTGSMLGTVRDELRLQSLQPFAAGSQITSEPPPDPEPKPASVEHVGQSPDIEPLTSAEQASKSPKQEEVENFEQLSSEGHAGNRPKQEEVENFVQLSSEGHAGQSPKQDEVENVVQLSSEGHEGNSPRQDKAENIVQLSSNGHADQSPNQDEAENFVQLIMEEHEGQSTQQEAGSISQVSQVSGLREQQAQTQSLQLSSEEQAAQSPDQEDADDLEYLTSMLESLMQGSLAADDNPSCPDEPVAAPCGNTGDLHSIPPSQMPEEHAAHFDTEVDGELVTDGCRAQAFVGSHLQEGFQSFLAGPMTNVHPVHRINVSADLLRCHSVGPIVWHVQTTDDGPGCNPEAVQTLAQLESPTELQSTLNAALHLVPSFKPCLSNLPRRCGIKTVGGLCKHADPKVDVTWLFFGSGAYGKLLQDQGRSPYHGRNMVHIPGWANAFRPQLLHHQTVLTDTLKFLRASSQADMASGARLPALHFCVAGLCLHLLACLFAMKCQQARSSTPVLQLFSRSNVYNLVSGRVGFGLEAFD